MIVTRPNSKRKKYFGIGEEAKRLGVTRKHLWMVLTGRRASKRLSSRVRIRTLDTREVAQ